MTTTVLSFLAGLAFLLLGMIKLSEKMGQVLGVKIRQFIKYLAKKPIHGIGLGALSTGIFQSSAAIIVLTIGMVGAGLITFEHSLPLILGAGIGTTITAQLVAFRVTTIAPLIILIGTLIWLLGRDKLKDWGKVIFYFGLLFFGLGLISQVVGLIKNNAVFMNLLSNLNNPWLGVLFGIIITIILQSSSATTSLLVIFGQQGLINIQVAIPIIL
ncbi:MAG: Na/Pi cotransporter family protein, partial [Candidatus Aenigmarchaeota archaeon]|nr:Na/Pi cotransporter family protein [Candidatus Aenigmarchaeota archaeon]